MRTPLKISIAVSAVFALSPVVAQSPALLVKDIAPRAARAGLVRLEEVPVVIGGRAFFAADDGFLGSELWATDGTPAGTRRVADLCPGRCAGEPQALRRSGDLLFFIAGNTTTGDNTFWVWRSDGTDDGTYPLADLKIDVFGSVGPISYLSPLRGGAVFIVRAGGRRGYDLWRTDGTRAGTRAIFALPGEFGLRTPDNRRHPFLSGSGPEVVRFDWQDAPWVTDGTALGTHPTAELPIRLCSNGEWIELDHRLIYPGVDDEKGCEPWVTDGTPAGTRRLRDLNPGSGSSFPVSFVGGRSDVYFTARDEFNRLQLWKTDGTTGGTVRVRTARPERPLNKAGILAAVGSRIYFVADDGVHGLELWKTDGNPATTQRVADLTPGPASSQILFGLAVGESLYFIARTAEAPDGSVFRTTGTAASTVRIEGTSQTGFLSAFGGRLLLEVNSADGDSSVLAISDGTAARPRTLFRLVRAPSSFPADFAATSRGLLFTADDGVHGGEIWRTDGRPSGTRLLADLLADNAGLVTRPRLFSSRDGVFISLLNFDPGPSVAWSDGGPEPPRILVDEGGLRFARGFVETAAGTSFFLDHGFTDPPGLDLWGSDGTPAGTAPLAAIDVGPETLAQVFVTPGPEPGTATFLAQSQRSTLVRTTDLFSTDGTAGGTRALGPLGLGNHTQVLALLSAAGRSFLVLYEEGRRSVSKLWTSDGTPEGTVELFRINNPFDHSFISEVAAASDRLYFTAEGRSGGIELWATDGTPEGTARVADIAPGRADSIPSDLFASGNRLYFGADDGEHGRELWTTDGTAAGTRQIEIRPGPRGSYPQGFTAIGDRVVFAADDGEHGLEIWESDGTAAGTRLVSDVVPGPVGSTPSGFARFGPDLFFSAGRPNVGYELFRVSAATLDLP